MSDAMTVGDDAVLDSLGAFLAATLLPEPERTPEPPRSPQPQERSPEPEPGGLSPLPWAVAPRNVSRAATLPWPTDGSGRVAVPSVVPRVAPSRRADVALTRQALQSPPEEVRPAVPDADAENGTGSEVRSAPSRLRLTLEWVGIVVGAVLVALVIRIAVIQSFVIPSASMYPTLHDNDRVLVNRLAYAAHDIRRGDVIVFDKPHFARVLPADTPAHLIKRVIGLPGDTIVARGGGVYVDSRRLREPYLAPGTLTQNLDTSITVPAGHVFVMGDNRMDSTDSRFFGPIPVKSVVGRAFARIWPPSRIGFL